MAQDLLDIYSDYLIAQSHHATATGLSSLLEGSISHDQITRFLNRNVFDSKDLWEYVKPKVRQMQQEQGGVSIKQNSSLEKSPTRRERSQKNHLFASLVGYCKLEFLKMKTHLNHFAIKYKLILKANQIAYLELRKLRESNAMPI